MPLVSTAPRNNQCMTADNVIMVETLTVPSGSEVETMVQLSSGSGTWLVEGNQCVHIGILVARAVVTPKNNTIPVRIVNTTALPVTVFKGMKIAMAELIDEAITSGITEIGSDEAYQYNQDPLMSLPEELTESQKNFLAVLSHYADVLASSIDDLGHTNVLSHKIDAGDMTCWKRWLFLHLKVLGHPLWS